MDVVLATVEWQYGLVYIDDITIFLMTPKKHLQHSYKLLKLLKKAEMTIKMKKCSFFSETKDYLAYIVAPGKVHVATKTTAAIKALQYRAAATELWSLLGLCNVYRRLVPNFAKLNSPLNKKLRKEEPLQLSLDRKRRR